VRHAAFSLPADDRPVHWTEGAKVRAISEIRDELDRATARRTELWQRLARGRDDESASELERLNARIAELWEELRTTQVRERFGSPEPILQRADRDRRLERELNRAVEAAESIRRAA
jgi:hypothetical protein